MPHPGVGFPGPPFEWPHVGRQWPSYNVESDQANGLMMWMPYGGGYPGSHHHADMIGGFAFTENGTPVWVGDGEHGWSMLFDNGQSEYLRINEAILSGTPLTLACWFNSDDDTTYQSLMCIGSDADSDNFFALLARGDAGDIIQAITRNDATAVGASTTTSWTANTWNHARAMFAAPNNRAAALNDGGKGTNTTACTPVGLDTTLIGAILRANPLFYMSGRLRDARVYDRVLTDAEGVRLYDPLTRWELFQIPRRLWRLGAPVGITIGMNTLSLTGAAQTMTQVSGAVSLTMDTLNLAGTAQALTQISGAVSLAMDTLGLAGSAQASTVSVGAVSLVMDVLDLVGAAQNLAVAPGAVTLAMDVLGLSATAQTLTVSTAIIIAMDALGLIGAAQSLAVSPGAVTLTMDALNLSGAAETLTQVSGAVALVMDALNLTGSAQSLTVSTGIFIAMTLLGLTGNAQALAVVPGEVTIAMSELQAAVAALALAVLVVGGKLDVALTDAAATLLASSDAVVTALATSNAAVTTLVLDDETRG